MSEVQSTTHYLVGDFGQVDSRNDDQNCAEAVLKAYTTAMQTVRDERKAFDAATLIYRARNWGVSDNAARRAVAGIICGKM